MKLLELLNANWSRKVINVVMAIVGIVYLAEIDGLDPGVARLAMYLIAGIGAIGVVLQCIIDIYQLKITGKLDPDTVSKVPFHDSVSQTQESLYHLPVETIDPILNERSQ